MTTTTARTMHSKTTHRRLHLEDDTDDDDTNENDALEDDTSRMAPITTTPTRMTHSKTTHLSQQLRRWIRC